jgi:hypothetical protein
LLPDSLPRHSCCQCSDCHSQRHTALCHLQDERRALLAQLQALQGEVAGQREELEQYAGNDPDRYDNMSEQWRRDLRQKLQHMLYDWIWLWPRCC